MNLLEKPITNIGFIISLIPQKQPFVMVDSLLYYSKDKVVSGLTILKDNLFSSKNTFAESGLVENMAQTAALHSGYQYFLTKEPIPTGYIGVIKKAEIFELPKVGDRITTTTSIIYEIMNITLIKSQVKYYGRVIASSEMKIVLA